MAQESIEIVRDGSPNQSHTGLTNTDLPSGEDRVEGLAPQEQCLSTDILGVDMALDKSAAFARQFVELVCNPDPNP